MQIYAKFINIQASYSVNMGERLIKIITINHDLLNLNSKPRMFVESLC